MNIVQGRQQNNHFARGRQVFNKVPEVTLYFWIIKILCTMVGETAADALSFFLGLTRVTFIIGSLLLITLFFQIALRRYVAGIYWFTVVSISVFSTLIIDSMTNNFGISQEITVIITSSALATIFALWYACEKTLSIRTVFTIRQESLYWLAVLLTFAFGIALEDFVANTLNLGYLVPAIILGIGSVVLAIAYLRFKLNTALIFWIAYILTHPLGSIVGNYLADNLDPILISTLFLIIILIIVIYLTVTKKDVQAPEGLPIIESKSHTQKV